MTAQHIIHTHSDPLGAARRLCVAKAHPSSHGRRKRNRRRLFPVNVVAVEAINYNNDKEINITSIPDHGRVERMRACRGPEVCHHAVVAVRHHVRKDHRLVDLDGTYICNGINIWLNKLKCAQPTHAADMYVSIRMEIRTIQLANHWRGQCRRTAPMRCQPHSCTHAARSRTAPGTTRTPAPVHTQGTCLCLQAFQPDRRKAAQHTVVRVTLARHVTRLVRRPPVSRHRLAVDPCHAIVMRWTCCCLCPNNRNTPSCVKMSVLLLVTMDVRHPRPCLPHVAAHESPVDGIETGPLRQQTNKQTNKQQTTKPPPQVAATALCQSHHTPCAPRKYVDWAEASAASASSTTAAIEAQKPEKRQTSKLFGKDLVRKRLNSTRYQVYTHE